MLCDFGLDIFLLFPGKIILPISFVSSFLAIYAVIVPRIINSTPTGKYGNPEDLIGALLFLVSPKGSSFVTGVVLPVDGGFHCYLGV